MKNIKWDSGRNGRYGPGNDENFGRAGFPLWRSCTCWRPSGPWGRKSIGRAGGSRWSWPARSLPGHGIVLGAAENDIAKRFAPAIVKAGAVFVDNSSAFGWTPMYPGHPRDQSPGRQEAQGHHRKPQTAPPLSLVAINALNQDSPIESIVASSYQATSGAGAGGPIELMNEVGGPAGGAKATVQGVPVSDRLQCHSPDRRWAFEGYTSEEMKMQNEGRKIMHLPELKVSCTCVRVPVVRSHSVSIVVRTKEKISVEHGGSSPPLRLPAGGRPEE